jgi:hypothetical protein
MLYVYRGQTRERSTTTEGESYMRLASLSGMLDASPIGPLRAPQPPQPPQAPQTPMTLPLRNRTTTEPYALDSFQNLLFSIARFHEVTGRYPARITVVGYEMKRRRFEELHARALRWPVERFEYVGIDASGEGVDVEAARMGEVCVFCLCVLFRAFTCLPLSILLTY